LSSQSLIVICGTAVSFNKKKSLAIAEKQPIVRLCLEQPCNMIAIDGYSRRGNFGGSLVRNMVLIYSADGTHVYGPINEEFAGKDRCLVESCKIVFLGGGEFLFIGSETFAVGCTG